MINESKVASMKHISRAIVAAVIAFVIITCIFATNAFAGLANEYNVVIDDNGNEYTITTDEKEPIEILNDANIALGANDKLNISSFEEGIGGKIIIDRLNTINVKSGDAITPYEVYANTVDEAFNEIGLNIDDCIINFDINEPVVNGMVIEVELPNAVTINADGKSFNITTLNTTVAEALQSTGITLGENDYTEPATDVVVENGTVINVFRVETKKVDINETIAFETTRKEDSSLSRGTTKVEVNGRDGEKLTTYEITYINGKESSRTELSSKVIKDAVNKVELVGTKPVAVAPNGVDSKGGYHVGQEISGRYTHYCACSICCGKNDGKTASGRKIQNGMANPYYIACNWLPLGSVVEVDGVEYTVVDRGGKGLSKQGRIDIFTPEGHAACYQKGTGSCSITIVRLGW